MKRKIVLSTIGFREYLYKNDCDIRSVSEIANGAPNPEMAKFITLNMQNTPNSSIRINEISTGNLKSFSQKVVSFNDIIAEMPSTSNTE
jgi:hypothetical protein